jgi:hypothetical protein
VVDSTGGIDENNEGDNAYEKTITVNKSNKPNLVFSTPTGKSDKVIVSKTRRAVGDSLSLIAKDRLLVSWSVQNNGGVKTPGKVTVRLKVDGVEKKIWKTTTKWMIPDSTWEKLDQPIGMFGVGKHEISLVLDGGEGIEGDDEIRKVINIQGEKGEVGAPTTFDGEWSVEAGREHSYQADGAKCGVGGEVEYQFDWGDGTTTGWLPVGRAAHKWNAENYPVKVRARCQGHPTIESKWLLRVVTVFSASSCEGSGGVD